MAREDVSLKYAHVERERRWLLAAEPVGLDVSATLRITDRYVDGTRLRLREVEHGDGRVVRKLDQKVRLGGSGSGAGEVAHTTIYLDEPEWAALLVLPSHVLVKRRSICVVDGVRVAVDVFGGHGRGLVLAEVDRGDGPDLGLPAVLDPVAEVTDDEFFTGGALAAAERDEVERRLTDFLQS
ncbi:hypothetical protein ACFP3Q_00065 [Nocardioides sp. GCM10027113]|uniref:hypothetical protein n=1 Tax=unclassified Nocardioides TaxID=2615069 RepID=UPI0036170155